MYALTQSTPSDDDTRNIVFLINFILIAGSVATLSTYRAAFLGFMMPQGAAIIAVFMILDNATSSYPLPVDPLGLVVWALQNDSSM